MNDHTRLSVLIPVFNFNITGLVKDLHQQAQECNIPFEIRCYDDGSEQDCKAQNRLIADLKNVVYKELPGNIGRSKIRNLLADEAEYEYLLFMDCDSETVNRIYIQNYVTNCRKDIVVYGGRSYHKTPPEEKEYYFRWYYGVQREQIRAEERKKHPYRNFMTNNFLIPKAVYQNIKMDENIKGYGHEDTLFGKHVMENNITVLHINNPLVHVGLERTTDFLEKTRQGIHNLAWMINEGLAYDEIKLYRYYRYFKKLGLRQVIVNRFEKRKEDIVQNLHSDQPSLKYFDFYKLGYLMKIMG